MRLFLWTVVALASLGLPELPHAADPPPRRPNVLFILADDLGYGDLGCYGQHQIKTPAIDRLAGEGIRFTSAYAGCTVCAPSRCTLLTGKHTGHSWVRANGMTTLDDELTIATMLKQAG